MTAALRSPESEFTALADHSTKLFARPFTALLRAIAASDEPARRRAFARCAAAIGDTMTLADLYGRRRVLLESDFADTRRFYAPTPELAMGGRMPELAFFAATPVVPDVPFSEAYADILRREPRLAGTAEKVAELYRTKHAFALARSAEVTLTEAVQRLVGRAMKEGIPTPSASAQVAELGDFTTAYAGTVYRTNLATAYTAGRFQQAKDPEVARILPAMERYSVTDSALRRGRPEDGGENHAAAHGLVAPVGDPIWRTHAPPSGYGCRCGIRMVARSELRRRGLLRDDGTVLRFEPPGFASFSAHPNFGSSPDAIYGGS